MFGGGGDASLNLCSLGAELEVSGMLSILLLASHNSSPSTIKPQLFFSFFKTLVGKEIAVELKNDVVLTGTLHSVDQYLNIKLTNVSVVNQDKYPQLMSLKNCFIRGSVVRYVQINPNDVDTELLQDATRKENSPVTDGK